MSAHGTGVSVLERTIELAHANKWSFAHKGVHAEISQHFRKDYDNPNYPDVPRDFPCWAHYIYLNEKQIPEEWRSRIILPVQINDIDYAKWNYYSDECILKDLVWWGGITYYDKIGGADGTPVIIKAGCDYNHSWDTEYGRCRNYTKEFVLTQCVETIEPLLKIVPLHVRCGWTGKYYPREVMTEWGDGHISPEGIAAREENFKKKNDIL